VELDRWEPAEAERELLACCAAPAWARAVVAGRPYGTLSAVLDSSDRTLDGLAWADLRPALDAHPRIGARPATTAGPTREQAWSQREQAGAQNTDDATSAALVEANRAYEERFGHVFLIFASGRTAGEMLAAARRRLHNDEETERAVVRHELKQITRLRVERLLT
jgi:2-oxo-4-hydroxy-4-carboxy-5-ureidoimidazoline decarboxylase